LRRDAWAIPRTTARSTCRSGACGGTGEPTPLFLAGGRACSTALATALAAARPLARPEVGKSAVGASADAPCAGAGRGPVIVSRVTPGDRQPIDWLREPNRVLEESARIDCHVDLCYEKSGGEFREELFTEGQEPRLRRCGSSSRLGTSCPDKSFELPFHSADPLFLAPSLVRPAIPALASLPKSGSTRRNHADSFDSNSPDRG
jgi:hypothetical protein